MFKDTGACLDAEAMRCSWTETLRKANVLMLKKQKRGAQVPVSCYVVGRQGDVFLLAVHDIKNLKQWKELEEKPTELESFPHCKVIVDNRRGVQQILVEKTGEAFGGNPEKPIDMIKNYIDQLYKDVECTVKINAKVLAADVWQAVKTFQDMGRRVTSVSFKMGSEEQVDVTNEEQAEFLRYLSKYNQIMGGAVAEFKSLAGNSKTGMAFCEANEDCFNLVRLIANNGYELVVRFSGRSVYRSKKKNAVAMFSLPDGFDKDFTTGVRMLDGELELVKWLDEIRINSEKYSDSEIKTKRRDNRGNRRVAASGKEANAHNSSFEGCRRVGHGV